MLCLACQRPGAGRLCGKCRALLRPAPERFVPGVGPVRSGYVHEGVARILVHNLKYRGVVSAARVLAVSVAGSVPAGAVLVPVPRVRWRTLKLGIDPALELAVALSGLTGRPVVRLLAAPWSGPVRAGRRHGSAPRYRLRAAPPARAVLLVDDVVTTGATLASAAALVPTVAGAVTATATPRKPGRLSAGGYRWPEVTDSGVTSLSTGRKL